MEFIRDAFRRQGSRRIIIFIFLGIFLYLMRDMLNMLLLTFILTYLIYNMQAFLVKRLKRFVYIKQKIMIIILYLIMGSTIVFVLYRYVPDLAKEVNSIAKSINDFINHPPEGKVGEVVKYLSKEIKIGEYAKQGLDFAWKSLASLGQWGFNILVALFLSLFFLLERGKIVRFTSKFKKSKISWLYDEIEYFGSRFLLSFGKVIQAQILIAFTNTVLSSICLWVMGFPQVLGLGVMIFILSLIPVAGTFISLVPLSIIAYSIGGFMKMLYIWGLIAALHAFEAYLLNPKFMSAKTELPIFYTFLILILGEHYLGIWGLIIGIPIFMFVMDILEVSTSDEDDGVIEEE